MFIMDEWPITHHHNRLAFILRMGRQGLIEASAKQEILRFLGVFGGASHQNYMKIIKWGLIVHTKIHLLQTAYYNLICGI